MDSKKLEIQKKLVETEKKLQESYSQQNKNEENQAVEAIRSNPKYFYTYAKRHNNLNTSIGSLEDKNGHLINDPSQMANILSEQYESAFSTPLQWPLDLGSRVDPNLSDINFTEADIRAAIGEISPNSAPGPDRFPATMLKQCEDELSNPLYIIWRKSLDTGEVPDVLRTSNITPIHKGGSKKLAKNYRPVALTSHLIKIFEKVVRKNIVQFVEENNLMNPNQHGFRSGRSCLSQLLQHHDHITRILEKGTNVDVIYLDFAKAFDKLDFRVTLQKLYNMGIVGNVFNWLRSFLSNRYQTVFLQGKKSNLVSVISGVPQGSVVGPLLFLIMLEDIDNATTFARVSSFADDTRVLGEISSLQDVAALQSDLEKIFQWSSDNNATFNSEKFECLRYGCDKLIVSSSVYLSNNCSVIESKPSVRDLGVTISSDGKFDEHVTNTVTSASQKCA